jgi:DNA-binding CsgD family transcriptional regulator
MAVQCGGCEQVLERFGLGADAEQVYTVLLGLPEADVPELAAACGLSEDRVQAAAAELARARLAHPIGHCWRADAPELALGALLTDRQRQLDEDRVELERLAANYRRASAAFEGSPQVRVLAGRAAVADGMRHVQLSAREEVRALVRAPLVALPPVENAATQFERMSDGLVYRVIYDQQAASGTDGEFLIHHSLEAGEQVRVAHELPVKLTMSDAGLAVVGIGDESWALGPGPEHSEPVALLVSQRSLLVVLEELFERLWSESAPVPAGDPGGPADEGGAGADGSDRPGPADVRLLALLVAGLPDRAVANHLGVGTRTVERRVRALADQAGVRTRIQLAVHAVRAGWI